MGFKALFIALVLVVLVYATLPADVVNHAVNVGMSILAGKGN